ncbi:hypothetical protein LTR36_001265 [Oleoguttula mirabilis]|uniref:DNA2/NAM7 helicase-like C-terminal domain-containing protein n=1 Tax=Oleoguttula mirabilis TaxID=1507867 RepID=A0AAV9JNU0_9PEZI|nr:hypothetical protein LTR36_001265 [Oleoguttula mirabilis]
MAAHASPPQKLISLRDYTRTRQKSQLSKGMVEDKHDEAGLAESVAADAAWPNGEITETEDAHKTSSAEGLATQIASDQTDSITHRAWRGPTSSTSRTNMTTPPADPWFEQNWGFGNERQFKTQLGRPAQSCALLVDGTSLDADLPLKPNLPEPPESQHFFRIRLSSNSQAPGLYLEHNNQANLPGTISECLLGSDDANILNSEQVASFMISPDQCERFEVTLWHTKPDTFAELDSHVKYYDYTGIQKACSVEWPGLKLRNDGEVRPLSDLSLMQLDIKFKSSENPVCRIRGESRFFDKSVSQQLNALAECSTLKIIVAYQARVAPLEWYRTMIHHCMRPNWSGMGTFSAYAAHHDDHSAPSDVSSLVDAMLGKYDRYSEYPTIPGHMYRKAEQNVRDVTTIAEKPVIATREQWVLRTVIALFRECQIVSSDDKFAFEQEREANTTALLRQMKAVRKIMDVPAHTQTFDIGRLVLGLSTCIYTLNLSVEFQSTTSWSNGDPITLYQRAAITSVIHKTRHLADNQQRELFSMSLEQCINGYIELTGSPGSGKTWCLAAVAMFYALHNQRTIVSAQHNVAVEELVRKYIRHTTDLEITDLSPHLKFVRLYHTSDKQRSTLCCGEQPQLHASANMQFPEYSLAYLTMAAADVYIPNASPALRNYRDALVVFRKSKRMLRDCEALTKAAEPAETEYLATCPVVFATADTLSSLLHLNRIQADALCVDDVSRMTVPQFNHVVQGSFSLRRVVAAGDPLQLGPKLQSVSCQTSEYACDLGRSPCQSFFLREGQRCYLLGNYRNPSSIARLLPDVGYYRPGMTSCCDQISPPKPNDTVDRIESRKSDPEVFFGRLANVDFRRKPFVFLSVPGGPYNTGLSIPSSTHSGMEYTVSTLASGDGEARRRRCKVASLPRKSRYHPDAGVVGTRLVKDLVHHVGIPAKEIAHISSYRKDADMLALRYRPNEVEDVENGAYAKLNVCTVDAFGGSEADVVVHSLVSAEDDALPWVGDAARTIVALTRTKKVYFIVGQWAELMRQRDHGGGGVRKRAQNLWTVLDWIERKGTIIHLTPADCTELAPAEQFKEQEIREDWRRRG